MKQTHELIQGSAEWHAHRANYLNASEASAMLGFSPYMTRAELLHLKKTGIQQEVDAGTQRRFDAGHQYEALMRPVAEAIIGDDLFSPTVTLEHEGLPLSASYDGATMDDITIWEHKSLNQGLAAAIAEGVLTDAYWPQAEQQLLIMGAERCLFMASNGPGTEVYMWYTSQPERRAQLVAGWHQFRKDLETFEPQAAKAEVVGRTPESMPALRIELTGMVTHSNLDAWKGFALAAISDINTDLQTDQDFADAEKAVKWCAENEAKLDATEEAALAQTESIAALFRTIRDVREQLRSKRLSLDKLIAAEKNNRRLEIQQGAQSDWMSHLAELSASIKPYTLPAITADFGAPMKGKRSIDSMTDAVSSELARKKVEASTIADKIRANIVTLDAAGYDFLSADRNQLAQKDAETLGLIIKDRIDAHNRKLEEQRQEALRKQKAAADDKVQRFDSLLGQCAGYTAAQTLEIRNNLAHQNLDVETYGQHLQDVLTARDQVLTALDHLITEKNKPVEVEPQPEQQRPLFSAAIHRPATDLRQPTNPVQAAAQHERPSAQAILDVVCAAYPNAPRHVVAHWLDNTRFVEAA